MHILASVLLLLADASLTSAQLQQRQSPVYKNAYSEALPIPAIKKPATTYLHPDTVSQFGTGQIGWI